MKFFIDKADLQSVLSKAALALPGKSIVSLLDNFVFELEANTLTVSATDTTTTIAVTEDVVVAEESNFRAILPAKKLIAIAKSAYEGEITFDIAPRKAVITSRTSEWVLNLADASQYPNLPSVGNVPWKQVNRVPFLDALTRVSSAVSFDSSSPGLCMVNISNNIFRASDRAHLHQMESEYGVPDFSISAFSIKTLTSALRMSASDEFSVVRGKNGFMAKIDRLTMSVAGLTAEFPDVTGVLLKPTLVNEAEIDVDKEDLLSAIRRTRVTVDADTKILSLRVSPHGLIVATKEAISNSRASEKVEIGYSGKDIVEANVNFFHMEQALLASHTSNVKLTLGKREGTKLPSVRLISQDGLFNAVMSQIRVDIL